MVPGRSHRIGVYEERSLDGHSWIDAKMEVDDKTERVDLHGSRRVVVNTRWARVRSGIPSFIWSRAG